MTKFHDFLCGFALVFSFIFMTSNYSTTSNCSAAEVKIEEKTDVEKAFGEEYDNSFLYKKTWLWFFTKEVTFPATQMSEYMKNISDEKAVVEKLQEESKDSTAKISINPTYSSFEVTGKNLLKEEQKLRSYRFDYFPLGDKMLKVFEEQKGFEDSTNKKVTITFSNGEVLLDIVDFLQIANLCLSIFFFLLCLLMIVMPPWDIFTFAMGGSLMGVALTIILQLILILLEGFISLIIA